MCWIRDQYSLDEPVLQAYINLILESNGLLVIALVT